MKDQSVYILQFVNSTMCEVSGSINSSIPVVFSLSFRDIGSFEGIPACFINSMWFFFQSSNILHKVKLVLGWGMKPKTHEYLAFRQDLISIAHFSVHIISALLPQLALMYS